MTLAKGGQPRICGPTLLYSGLLGVGGAQLTPAKKEGRR
jgi:hypothetical protein